MPVGTTRSGAILAVLLAAGCLTACGNRLPASELRAAAGLAPAPAPAGAAAASLPDQTAGLPATDTGSDPGQVPAGAATAVGAGAGSTATSAGGPSSPVASGSARSAARGPAAPSAAAAGTGSVASPSNPSSGGATGPTPGGGPSAPSAPGPGPGACAGNCGPIVIGSVGTYTGIVGQTVGPGVQGVQAWVADINARGGLNGRQVRFIVAEDGADPARHRALIQELVEQRGVIAFVYNAAPLSGQSSIDYLTKVGVPAVGSEGGSDWFNQSPMFFPQNSSGKQLVMTPVASATVSMLPNGIKKLGMIYCSDGIQVCEDARQLVPGESKKYGFDFVYSGSGSLAQPDFTANCLAARDAGAQMILMMMDRNSAQRVARGCKNVGYKPFILLSQTIENDALATDDNLQGSVGTGIVAPWFDLTNPAVAAFRRAMATYAPGVDPSGITIVGWAAAKLFERSLRGVTGPVTPATILQGLWSIKADTLDGLTPPLTYVKGQPAARYVCYWPLVISNKKFVNATDGKGHCI